MEIKWAVGENHNKAIKQQTHRPDFMLIWVNPNELIANVDPEMRVDADTKENHIGNRMERATEHFLSGEWMDAPIIAFDRYTSKDYKIVVDDGRHRIASLKALNVDLFPAYIMKDDLEQIKGVLRVA